MPAIATCKPKAAEIIDLYAQGKSVRAIAHVLKLGKSAVGMWLASADEDGQLTRAREANATNHAEEALKAVRSGVVAARRGDIARSKALTSAYDKLAAQHRWHAERVGKLWAPLQKVDIDARIAVLTAYLDMSGPPPPLQADATVEASSMPHVAAPDDVRDEE